MPQTKLTKSFVQAVHAPTTKSKETHSDTVTKGLVLEVRPGGGRTFYFRYHNAQGRQCNIKIGDPNVVDLDTARQAVEQHQQDLALGRDPAADRREQRDVPTLEAFVQERYLPYVKSYKKSWQTDQSILRNHVLPVFGDRRMHDIKRREIQKFAHDKHQGGHAPGSVNRLVVLLRYIYNLALEWETPGVHANPATKVKQIPIERDQKRYLTQDEVERLMAAVRTSPNPDLEDIVSFLLLTGARRGEVLNAEWKDIDFNRRVWTIPKNKSRTPRHVPLSDSAVDLLANLRTRGTSKYLFVNRWTGEPYQHLHSQWDRARKLAGLPHVRIHDLRHSFASFLINSGRSLYEVKKLLGHHSISVTEKYAHLQNETLIEAMNNVPVNVGRGRDEDQPATEDHHANVPG